MSRHLVAGGAGFLGSHLCDRLVDRGDQVVCVDDLSTGRLSNLSHLLVRDGFSFIEADVTSPLDVDGHLDGIFHLASPASPPAYLQRPIETLEVGSTGTRRLLDLATSHRARFFLASTSEIYGDPLEHPQRESYRGNVDTTGPRSVYDEAKRFAEALTMAYRRSRGTNTTIVRIFNTYGPRLAPGDGRVVSNFIVQALRGDPLTVYGDGSQTRSLCFVADEIAGILALFDSDEPGPVNIGNPDERTVLELGREVLRVTESSSEIVFRPLPIDDPTRRCPDITVARQRLGWEPLVSLEDGLTQAVEYFRSVIATENRTDG